MEIEEKRHAGGMVLDQIPGADGVYLPTGNQSDGGLRSRGTRGIMEGLRDIIGSEIVDVKPEVIDPNAVVNARDKKRIDAQNPMRQDSDTYEDPDEYEIEDDILE